MKLNLDKDQHLLTDEGVLRKEVLEARLNDKDKVIEIGAGEGILTKELVKKAGEVLSFEIDEKFKKNLDELKEYKNLKIIYDNCLNYSWKGYNKIVSNIPYSLSEPIIMKSMKNNITFLVLIVGENFKRILEEKNSKIGIIVNLFYKLDIISKVDKKSFNPSPRVDSFLIKLELRKEKNKINKLLRKIIMREGKIKNAVLYSLVESGKTKRQAKEIINKLGINKEILEKPVNKITGKFIIRLRKEFQEKAF